MDIIKNTLQYITANAGLLEHEISIPWFTVNRILDETE